MLEELYTDNRKYFQYESFTSFKQTLFTTPCVQGKMKFKVLYKQESKNTYGL